MYRMIFRRNNRSDQHSSWNAWNFCFLAFSRKFILVKMKEFFKFALRKFHFPEYMKFFKNFFFFFWVWKVSPWNVLILKLEISISRNIRKTFFWENIRTFLILGSKSSVSQNIRNFFRVDSFNYFSSLG